MKKKKKITLWVVWKNRVTLKITSDRAERLRKAPKSLFPHYLKKRKKWKKHNFMGSLKKSRHDMSSWHDMASWHDMSSWHDLLSWHEMSSCHGGYWGNTQNHARSRREASKRSKFPIPPLTKKWKNEKNNFMSSLKKQGDPQNNVRSRREASKSSKFPIPPTI